MRITGVESTELFMGSAGRPLQIIRVTVTAGHLHRDGAADPAAIEVRVGGAGIAGQRPGRADAAPRQDSPASPGGEPGQDVTIDVGVQVAGHHRPGTAVPVTVIAQAGDQRVEQQATVTVAEPGWTMWMVSHFHYDPVWWSTQGQFTEARLVLPDEDGAMLDTRTAFDLVQLHLAKARLDPDYKFVLAEVDYLKPHFDAFPQDRALVRELLADGRLELVGGTYNEPNTNLTGAEVTIRNAVYGMGFQRDVLGGDPRSAWMLDSFGHDPGFPGLMAQAGLTSSSWARGPFHQWGPGDNTRMQFPAEFEWLSPDGTGVLTAYMANHYGAGWKLHTAADLAAAQAAALAEFRSLAQVAATRNVMLPVGADHVIPARWVTDIHRSWNAAYVWPRFVTAVPREFFDAVRAEAGSSPASTPRDQAGRRGITPQTRDMNPLYTGKDVSYIDTKQAHRAGETAVSEGERLATLAWLAGAPYPAESLDKAWRQLAFGAHHDAITGTEGDQVYLDLLAGWREAAERGEAARLSAVTALAGPSSQRSVTVFNGLPHERDGLATVTVRVAEPGTPWLALIDPAGTAGTAAAEGASASAGTEVPALAEGVTRHPDGSLAQVTLTFRVGRVPALGSRRYALRAVPGPAAGQGWSDLPQDGTAEPGIANDAIAITADPARGGTLTITDRRTGRRVLRGPGNELVLQEEYDKHPQWGEGAWHLSPTGAATGSASLAAQVRAQRSPIGSRLVATFTLGDLRVTQETLLRDGADRAEFRTDVDGSIGKDRLLRVRFPADLPGALPVYQTATAVIGRPFGQPAVDTARHWWTLDNPAHHWFGLGSVARAALIAPGRPAAVIQAIGVAEVITPDLVPDDPARGARDLLISLAGVGVTATCSRADGPRYGAMDVDSNLPDFRISIGGPQESSFTASVLAACDPAVPERLDKLLAEEGTARLWVPAARPRAEAFGPDADVRGPRDLPVLIVAGAEDAAAAAPAATTAPGQAQTAAAVDAVRADLLAGGLVALVELAPDEPWPGDLLADGAVALFNRGTPGGAVEVDGTLWMSLMRACSSWPSGVWIDGDRRTAGDGSSFAWQHWSHTFCYALAFTGSGDWRSAGFSAAAEDYNHDLIAVVTDPATVPAAEAPAAVPAPAAPGVSLVTVVPPNVSMLALKPRGNPLASGRPGTAGAATPPADKTLPAGKEITIRLRETDGRPTVARVELAAGIASARLIDLLEESEGTPLTIARGSALVELAPFGTVTVALTPKRVTAGPAGASARPGTLAPPEAVQPVHSRYWLHGKGSAPAGNLPAAVHLAPARVTLRESGLEVFDTASADAGRGAAEVNQGAADVGQLRLTVAAGPAGGAGEVDVLAPDGLVIAAADGQPLAYDLAGGEYASWDVSVRAVPQAPDGRYFVAARIRDGLGQVIEDTALVTVGEPAAAAADQDPMESFILLQAETMALAGEVDLTMVTPSLSLQAGASGSLRVVVSNHLASPLWGEAQLLCPFGSWEMAPDWASAVRADPGESASLSFPVTVPATTPAGFQTWLLVKLMYFGRVRYSEAIRLTVSP
jgi:alpha-mannosidase